MAEPHSESGHHVVSPIVYFAIFAGLLVLTWVTVQVAYVDLGRYNVVVALAIAISKATLVLLFFMHLKYGPQLNVVVAGASVVWLVMMLLFFMSDFATRLPLSSAGF